MHQPFKVNYSDAEGFSKVWNHKGIIIPLQEPHIQFATDYANVVLNSFVQQTLQASAAKQKAAEEAKAKPLVTLTD